MQSIKGQLMDLAGTGSVVEVDNSFSVTDEDAPTFLALTFKTLNGFLGSLLSKVISISPG